MSRSGSGRQLVGVGAVDAVHRDAVAPRHEADDGVPGHGGAALRELDPHVGRADDDDAGVAGLAPAGGALGTVASARSSVAPSTPPIEATTLPTTCWAETCPSPTAAYSASMSW